MSWPPPYFRLAEDIVESFGLPSGPSRDKAMQEVQTLLLAALGDPGKPQTRAIEVATGVFVAPEHVRAVRDSRADGRSVDKGRCIVVIGAGGFYIEADGTAAEVAAKLWPVEAWEIPESTKKAIKSLATALEIETVVRENVLSVLDCGTWADRQDSDAASDVANAIAYGIRAALQKVGLL